MPDNRSMLVVDDEEVVCQVCQRIFSRQGFRVETNTDARQGLAQATEKDYEIILLDIKMPNMDGIQFLEPLRKKKPDVPVLIITGYPSIPNAAAAMRLGASDYVTKPFTAEEITWAVQRVLAVQRELSGDSPPEAAAAESPLGAKWIGKALFWDEAWVRTEMDGSACAGSSAPRPARGRGYRDPPAADRRGGLPRLALGGRHPGQQDRAGGPRAGVRRGRGRQRALAAAARMAGKRSVRRGLDRVHLHHAP